MIHVIGDMVQSVGVMISGFLIWLQPFDLGETSEGISVWMYADPVVTWLFSILVILTTVGTIRRGIEAVLMSVPDHIDASALKRSICKVEHVVSVHDLHVWMVGSSSVCTGHIIIDDLEASMEVLRKVIIMVQEKHEIGHSTFQIEVAGKFDHSIEHLRLGDQSCHDIHCNASDTCP